MNPATRDPVQVGVVGFGLAGRVLHAPLLQAAGMTIRAMVTRRPDAVAESLPGAMAVPDIAALLALHKLDVVVIATPNDLHEEQALAALAAGKCVVVDKPLATDPQSAEKLLKAAQRGPGTLTVFHNRRWDSDFLTVQRLLAAGTLGPLHTFEARWNRYRPQVVERWREHEEQGGGLLLDLGPHLIDQTLQLFGTPDWLQADLQCRRAGAEVEDSFELRMAYDELRVVLGADSVMADNGPRFRLHGERASFTKSGLDVQEAQLRAGRSPLDADFGVEPDTQRGLLVSGEDGLQQPLPTEQGRWIDFYRAVRAHVEVGSPLPVDPEQACAGLRLIAAARHSAATGQRVML